MSTVKTRLVEVITTLVVLGAVAGWSLFWGMVARIHYLHGDLGSALFTTTLFVVPAVAGFVWYVSESIGISIQLPNTDADILGS